MASKTVVTTLGFIVGEGIYFVLIFYVWEAVGWQPSTALPFVSLAIFIAGCFAIPFAWAYLANEMTRNRTVPFAVTVCIILFVVVLVCCRIDQAISASASGFNKYLASPNALGENGVGRELSNIFQLWLSGAVFVVSYVVLANRRHKDSTREESA